jgi:hypothetical protein
VGATRKKEKRKEYQNIQHLMVHKMHIRRANSEEKLLHTFETLLQKYLLSETTTQQDDLLVLEPPKIYTTTLTLVITL